MFGHDDFEIIHDNARFSTCKEARNFKKAHNIKEFFIKIPPYSPDMNIIEHIRAIVRREKNLIVREYGQPPTRELLYNFLRKFGVRLTKM